MSKLQPAIYQEWQRGFKQSVQEQSSKKFIGGRKKTVGASDVEAV